MSPRVARRTPRPRWTRRRPPCNCCAPSWAPVRSTAEEGPPTAASTAIVGGSTYARCMGPGGQPDMSQLLKQGQKMQQALADAQAELAEAEVTGSAGGGLVTATMTGSGDVVTVTIAPAAVDPDDVETLQDLVVAAIRDAQRAVNELAADTMGPLTGGLGGGLGLPGF